MDIFSLLSLLQMGLGQGGGGVPEPSSGYDYEYGPQEILGPPEPEGEGISKYLPFAKGGVSGVKGIAGVLMGQQAAREEEERRKKQEALRRAAEMSRRFEQAGWGGY